MIVTQQREIVDGEGKATFLKQLANGFVDMLFVMQNRNGREPSFNITGFTLQHEFHVSGFGTFHTEYDHNVVRRPNRRHVESINQRRLNEVPAAAIRRIISCREAMY
jgi:hypothetical protein